MNSLDYREIAALIEWHKTEQDKLGLGQSEEWVAHAKRAAELERLIEEWEPV